METGAIVAVTTHSGAAADTATVKETVIEAGIAVAGLIVEKTPEGKFEVHPEGVEEVVADKGYHSNDVVVGLSEMEVRSYVAEPDRGTRNWDGKEAEKEAAYGNRRRVQGERGKRLQRQRGRADREELRTSVRQRRTGSSLRARTGERAQEVPDPGCRMQPRAPDALDVWLGQAQSRS